MVGALSTLVLVSGSGGHAGGPRGDVLSSCVSPFDSFDCVVLRVMVGASGLAAGTSGVT